MTPTDNIKKQIKNLKTHASAELDEKLHQRFQHALDTEKTIPADHQPIIWRTIMHSRIIKLTVAACFAIAVSIAITFVRISVPTASAAEIFSQALQAIEKLNSFHIKVEMRTPPGDNFACIGLNYDFVPIDFWRLNTEDCLGKWRLESPGRVVVMDGTKSSMLFKNLNMIHEVRDRDPERYWKECLVELQNILEREAQKAISENADIEVVNETGKDGRDKIIITTEALSKVPENDNLRNKYIEDSDHQRIYTFDAQTKLLEDLEIYVHDKDKDVLVFRLVEIEYNPQLDSKLFVFEAPENAIYTVPLEILPDNEKYEKMTPKEAAITYFTAWAKEDWQELLKFEGQTDIPQQMKDYFGGLEILEIGEPFQSANYSGWFIPYKIKLKSGQVREHNLALRKDNSANRWEFDGGL